MNQTPPLSAPFDLGSLSEPRLETIAPSAEMLSRIAAWADLDALPGLKAELRLSRSGHDFYVLEGRLVADVVQSCVVTLEPVPSHIEREFARRYQVVRKRRSEPPHPEKAETDGDGDVETVSHPVIDLAAPVLEELSLAIDPYPRAPGAVFALFEEGEEAAGSPFAVLEAFKARGGKPGKS